MVREILSNSSSNAILIYSLIQGTKLMRHFNEMTVGLLVVALMSLASLALAEDNRVTSIEYANGDVYTVKSNENVFVSKNDNLWTYSVQSKSLKFEKQWPTRLSNEVIAPPNTNPVGQHEWCKAHELFAYGYTFDDQLFMRSCDTNNDSKYGCGDSQFDESDDGDACPNG